MKKGFTLAEILITLGIVGVVAALTLPGVVMSYQKKVYVAQLQRIYNQFVNGTKAVMSENGVDKLGELESGVRGGASFLNKILTVARVASPGQALATSYKSLDSDKTISVGTNGEEKGLLYCAVVDTGASVCMYNISTAGYSTVYVDLNGPNKPNVIGRDFYSFSLTPTGKIEASASKDKCTGASKLSAGAYCLGTVRGYNWTMDY